jgi:Flp pilus assembly protein CpaB
MRRRRTFIIVFAVLVVILVVGVIALVTRGGGLGLGPQEEPTRVAAETVVSPTPVPEKPVIVAVQPVRRGMRIPREAVQIRRWPVDELPFDPVTNLDDIIGMFAATDLVPRQPIRASQIKRVFLEGADIDLAIPQGKVAYAMPVRVLSTVANALQPGSRVDVLISFLVVDVDEDTQVKFPAPERCPPEELLTECVVVGGEQMPGLVSQYTVQNALVLGVGVWGEEEAGVEVLGPGEDAGEEPTPTPVAAPQEGEEPAPTPTPEPRSIKSITVVTMAIDPQDALVLKWAWESDASVDFALRSAIDDQPFAQPESVTLQYMFERFQIALPPKLPHVAENKFQYRLLEGAVIVTQE